ncbi:hypothetical protein BN8_06326 [Fibrisoma limi BUZ 3]|uniref:Protein BatD n=1 Tax=Fibrisoma limi BUZ 3 TaxID=1185876 RepID=I2GSQ7_9BACT|nr:BatD family protein [Fibrisoma limi]CCH56936.1 hypothetical protein BN8_06326 [Fibrisoma limi BUZ 3]
MLLEVFRKFLVLFFCCISVAFGQSTENLVTIELSQTSFSIERPFTISVIAPNSENRPTINFPDIPGFVKRGTSASFTSSEVENKTVVNQVVTQTYQAKLPGRYKLPPFSVTVNGFVARSEGATLIVRPTAAVASGPGATTLVTPATPPNGSAFLNLKASRSSIYAGEGVALSLAFYVADDYPYELELSFRALDRQLQTILKKIRPANAWEENVGINELNPIPVTVAGRKFREYLLYQAIYFPLSAQPLRLPAVSLWLARPRPKVGPPLAQPETVVFTSKPLTVNVRPLPPHPLRGQVPVGTYQLVESVERTRVSIGKSIRYSFAIEGEGNIATLQAPAAVTDQASAAVDIFPPKERQVISRDGGRVTGRKQFTYFLIPRENGPLPLADRFQWVFFNPRTARYDTLHSRIQLQVGTATAAVASANTGMEKQAISVSPGVSTPVSIYAGIDKLDSSYQPINGAVLVRAVANVLIILMLLGMLVVFFRR